MSTTAWFTVEESKVVWAPIGQYVNKKGETKTRFKRIGVKIKMQDGSWWFFSFTHETWTRHLPLVRKMDRLGRPEVDPQGKPVFLPERKDSYTTPKLHREWGDRKPELVRCLENALVESEESESED